MINRLITITAVLVLCTCLSAHALIFDLDPSDGAISGAPGATIGWGYRIENNSLTDSVVIGGSSFTTAATWGTYDDYFLDPDNFLWLDPGDIFFQTFNESLIEGMGAFTIDPLALPGWTAVGIIELSYELIDESFNFSGPFTASDFAEITVSGGAPVPEPATIFLIGSGIAGLAGIRRRRNTIS